MDVDSNVISISQFFRVITLGRQCPLVEKLQMRWSPSTCIHNDCHSEPFKLYASKRWLVRNRP